jgi:disulfide bond formation protein DsbB
MKKYLLIIALVQAIIAMLGSLYFSEIEHYIPCVLCWYQRICMYPLVPIILVGLWENNPGIYKYVLPLGLVGWGIAFYHNLLYYNFIPESVYSCTNGISCTTKYIEWFGFVTIPLLSLVAFTVIIISMIFYARSKDQG